MANGSNGVSRIPGFFIGGGVGVSNAAILFGSLALLGLTWLWMNNKKTIDMSDAAAENEVMSDVYAYAANQTTIENNHDRIREAIKRIREKFKDARDAFKKKHRDLVLARRAGTITNAQYRAQLRMAIDEFHAAIRLRHQEIMLQLGIPRHSDMAYVTPTMS